MTPLEIAELIGLVAVILALLITFIVAIARGDIKKLVEEKMAEAEKHKDWSAKMKFQYVLDAVKEKYKLATLVLNVSKLIEHIIDLSKKINYKK